MISLLILERAGYEPSVALQPLRIMVSPRAVSICMGLSAKCPFGNQMFRCGPNLAAIPKPGRIGRKKTRACAKHGGLGFTRIRQSLRDARA
jgi:hypothetical protein